MRGTMLASQGVVALKLNEEDVEGAQTELTRSPSRPSRAKGARLAAWALSLLSAFV